MKYLAAMAFALCALTTTAFAQEGGQGANASVPGSTCGALTPAPMPPTAARIRADDMNAAIARYEAWRQAAQPVFDCRRAEAEALQAQANARAGEYLAAQAQSASAVAAWQAAVEAFNNRQRR